MTKQMLILPTFDGQNRGAAVVDAANISMMKPAATPGVTNVYMAGDFGSNCVNVYMELPLLVEALKKAGIGILDLGGGKHMASAERQNDGH